MSHENPALKYTVYTLSSRCPKCGEVQSKEYSHGIESYECSKGHYWEKSPMSTTAAIMGVIGGVRL